MTTYSKYVNEILKGWTCQDLIHPWSTSCGQSFLDYMANWSFDGVKFFFPAIMISVVMKTKDNYTKAILKGIFDIFLCSAIGHVSFAIAMSWSCIFYNIFKRCYYSTTVLIPTFLGAQTVNLLPNNAIVGHANPFACMFFEILIKFMDFDCMKSMRKSKWWGTLWFMCGSAGLLHLLAKQRKTGVFWFIIPPKITKSTNVETPNEEDVRKIVTLCTHKEKCVSFILQGMRTYANYGLMLEILRNITANLGRIKSNPSQFLTLATKRINYNLVTFLMAYIGCYRLTSCLLKNYTSGHSVDFVNIAAGFAGGLAYAVWPNYNLFTTCIVTMLQVYWQYLLAQENCPKAVREVNKLPLSGLIYGICMAVCVQTMVFYPDKTAHLSYIATRANSSGAVDGLKFTLTRPFFDAPFKYD
ncbi:uncharacterized protein LOC132264332 [Phlebotomus argentipes]|uniref:uncharacterized protein LOC132264332 n=1 Tax=Phlebotomus argentipes TaxID=94469 RepID=UPI002892E6AB|nr:uncharacterized protein LOC132264332 [Phlebotomus argentipes]